MSREADLHVGVVPMPGFTMLAFAGLIDSLRLAADEGDRSRPIRCRWTVLGERRAPVRASNGTIMQTAADFGDPARFHYVAVVGGLLHDGPQETPALLAFLRSAADTGVPLIGLCTGSFTLARAGLMAGRRACVSWFHHAEFAAEFPRIPVVSDRLFLDDGERITCAGGVSVIHLASHLIERHCGPGAAAKGLRIMIEETQRAGSTPQPTPRLAVGPDARVLGAEIVDERVRRALLAAERRLAGPLSSADLARAAGVSGRQLHRIFRQALGRTPAQAVAQLRLARAEAMLDDCHLALADVAAACGFTDAPHLIRRWRREHGSTPRGRNAAPKPTQGGRQARPVSR